MWIPLLKQRGNCGIVNRQWPKCLFQGYMTVNYHLVVLHPIKKPRDLAGLFATF